MIRLREQIPIIEALEFFVRPELKGKSAPLVSGPYGDRLKPTNLCVSAYFAILSSMGISLHLLLSSLNQF